MIEGERVQLCQRSHPWTGRAYAVARTGARDVERLGAALSAPLVSHLVPSAVATRRARSRGVAHCRGRPSERSDFPNDPQHFDAKMYPAENPRVGGSIPSSGTTKTPLFSGVFRFWAIHPRGTGDMPGDVARAKRRVDTRIDCARSYGTSSMRHPARRGQTTGAVTAYSPSSVAPQKQRPLTRRTPREVRRARSSLKPALTRLRRRPLRHESRLSRACRSFEERGF